MARLAMRMTEDDFRKWIRTKFYATLLPPNDEDCKNDRIMIDRFVDESMIEEYLLRNYYKYNYVFDESLFDAFPLVKKDLSKLYFSYENLNLALGIQEQYGANDTVYFYERNGVCLMLCEVGGDWETPIWFVLYVDNKNQLRAYIPKKGNTYCVKYKCAYGSIGDVDTNLSAEEAEELDEAGHELEVDFDLLLEDAFCRIIAV